jgi:hypothetical protein
MTSECLYEEDIERRRRDAFSYYPNIFKEFFFYENNTRGISVADLLADVWTRIPGCHFSVLPYYTVNNENISNGRIIDDDRKLRVKK